MSYLEVFYLDFQIGIFLDILFLNVNSVVARGCTLAIDT